MNYFNMEDIFAMLKSSEDAEIIANDFTAALNAAIQEKKEEERIAAEAKRKEAEKARIETEKNALATELLNKIFDFGEKYYPKIFVAGVRDEINVTDFLKSMDETYKIMTAEPFLSELFTKLNVEPKRDKTVTLNEFKPHVDPLTEFLKREGLI